MPIYEYACPHCGPFSTMCRMSESALPLDCPSCGGVSPRIPSAPGLARMSANARTAMERHEKSAHEPQRLRDVKAGERAQGRSKAVRRVPAPNARPWMLGH
jgi:putative FmdB family regulatory protein